MNERILHLEGVFSRSNLDCLVSFVYALNDGLLKKELWDYVLNFKDICLTCEINETIFPSDRKGGSRILYSMKSFKNCIDYCDLVELPLNRKKFTWSRGNAANRIDRIFMLIDWLQLFPSFTLYRLPKYSLDHRPIHLLLNSANWGPKPFQFMNYWWLLFDFKKKSRVQLYKFGDRNSYFFHLSTTTRQKKNQIFSLDVDGTTLTKPSDVKKVMFNFFSKLYSHDGRPRASCCNLDFLKL
ncbi:hypothetical protein Peur_052129 [Populus x canadensis]